MSQEEVGGGKAGSGPFMDDLVICPSDGMIDMFLDLKQLSGLPESTDKTQHQAFAQQYVVHSQLTSVDAVIMIYTLFRLHAETVRDEWGFKEKLAELVKLTNIIKDPIEMIGQFYCQLVDRYLAKKYACYVMLADKVTAHPLDLLESEKTVRYTTKKRCSACQAVSAVLLVCGACKKVAYCNVECQKKDRSSHRKFCKFCLSDGPKEVNQ